MAPLAVDLSSCFVVNVVHLNSSPVCCNSDSDPTRIVRGDAEKQRRQESESREVAD